MSLGLGIDIGASSVTAAVVRHRRGSLSLERFFHIPLDELETEGVDTSSPRSVARAVAGRFAERGVRPRGVVGVSGRDAIIRYSHMPPMPAWRLALLVGFEVNEVAEKTGEALSSDFRVLQSSSDGSLVLVALAKDAQVTETVDALESAGVEASGALPQPVATGDAYRFLADDADSGTRLVLDVGHSSTEVALVERGDLLFARSVALGGEVCTHRLRQLLGLDRAEAEEVLDSCRTPDGDDAGDLLGPARQRIAAMVEASLDFARKQVRQGRIALDGVVVTGGGARIPGLAEAIGETLGCPAERFDPSEHLDASAADRASREELERSGPEGTTAIGLAFSSVLPRATVLNLLPLSVKERLQFRHRTAWLYASGAVVAVAVLVSLVFALWGRSTQSERHDELAQALGVVEARQRSHEALAAENESRHEELRALGRRARAGFHAASLLETLGEALPPEVTLTRVELASAATGALRFHLEGRADDAQRTGVDAVRRLELSLAEDPQVASAKVEDVESAAAALRFALTVVPAGNPTSDDEGEGS